MPPARPNILFAIADDWSFGHAAAYGCKWVNMPAFDRVAAEGLLFNRAYTPNAKCAPSRAAILTGRNSWQLKEAGNHGGFFPPEFKTFTEALAETGYHCGLTEKGWAPGVALTAAGEHRPLIGPSYDSRQLEPPTPDISSNDYAANFADFLDDNPSGKPWFFWYGCIEPHRAYTYGSGAKLGGKSIDDIDHVPGIWPDNEQVRHDLLDYAFEAEHFDSHLERMLAELDRRGEAENTIVVVTSDNGMPFPRAKGQEYEISNHLPLAIRWPAGIVQPNRTISDFVSFIDFAPTFLAAAQVSWSDAGLAPSPGKSLFDCFTGADTSHRDHVLIGKERHDVGRPFDAGYPIRGLREGDWLYLYNFKSDRWPAGNPETGYLNCDGSPTKTAILESREDPALAHYWQNAFGKRPPTELYHVGDDPDCLVNLAHVPAHAAVRSQMHARLFAALSAQNDPRMSDGPQIEDYPPAVEKWRDYYAKHQRGEAVPPDWTHPSDVQIIAE
jgi:N-sulfoglucosamine sulfohydrolase